jgi:hypothetical protein
MNVPHIEKSISRLNDAAADRALLPDEIRHL